MPTSFFAVNSKDYIDILVLGTSTTFKSRIFILLPPFLLREVNIAILDHQDSA
jgi:hypothetical protein